MEKNLALWRKIEKVIQSDKFIMRESQRSNVSVLTNHHQDDCFLKPKH